jgi:hypothetical protein
MEEHELFVLANDSSSVVLANNPLMLCGLHLAQTNLNLFQ